MIVGVGIDLVSIEKIGESLESEAFRRKAFTPAEIDSCEGVHNSAERFAGKFAAKEAFMKAVKRGLQQGLWFTQIEVLTADTGAPFIQVTGEARRALEDLKAEHVHVSISHTQGSAIAIVILENKKP